MCFETRFQYSDMSEDEILECINETINTDVGLYSGNNMYKSYCFEDGYEKVFSIEEFEI